MSEMNLETTERACVDGCGDRLAEPGKAVYDLIGPSYETTTEEMSEVRLRFGQRRDGNFGIHV